METRFGIGRVLGTGLKIWGKNLPSFVLITAVVYIPLIVWAIVAATGGATQVEAFNRYHAAADSLLGLAASAAITYGVVMELQGQHASIGDSFATGLARFFPVLGVGILSALCVALGMLLLIVPGLIVFCMLFVASPAAVLERPGLTGALGRSRELTRGHKLEIFALIVLVSILNGVISAIVQGLITSDVYVQLVINIFTGSLYAVIQAVSYYYLRAEKEGTSASELARIFD